MNEHTCTPGVSIEDHAIVCQYAAGLQSENAKHRAENARLRELLALAFNYFPEPDCTSWECDKGSHIERLLAYQRIEDALGRRGVL